MSREHHCVWKKMVLHFCDHLILFLDYQENGRGNTCLPNFGAHPSIYTASYSSRLKLLQIPHETWFILLSLKDGALWTANHNGFICHPRKIKVKVTQSHYRPGEALSVPGGWGSQSSIQLAHEGGKFVNLRTNHLYSPGKIPGTHFC